MALSHATFGRIIVFNISLIVFNILKVNAMVATIEVVMVQKERILQERQLTYGLLHILQDFVYKEMGKNLEAFEIKSTSIILNTSHWERKNNRCPCLSGSRECSSTTGTSL